MEKKSLGNFMLDESGLDYYVINEGKVTFSNIVGSAYLSPSLGVRRWKLAQIVLEGLNEFGKTNGQVLDGL